MLQSFVITVREGVEAFLIIAISIAFLKKAGKRNLLPAVYWGIFVSLLFSFGAGIALRAGVDQSFWEGVLAAAAALLVGTLIIYMWRAARTMKKNIEAHLESATSHINSRMAYWGVFFFTLLMITREGMETALMLISISFQVSSLPFIAGAVLGVLAAAGIALLWARYGHRVNLSLFFQVTAVFMGVFVVQLLIYSFHEFCEAGLFPNSDALHAATEPYGPDGVYGKLLSYFLVLLPLAWLAFSAALDRFKGQPLPTMVRRPSKGD